MSGILPEDKIKECQIVFKKFSKDGENLTERELKNALNALGASPTKEEIEEIMRDIDKDCSGKVELQEFLEIFAKNMKDPDIEDDLMDAFKNFDIFNKNYIAVEEMRRFMTTCGTKMSNTDFDNFMKIQDARSWWAKFNRKRFNYSRILFRGAGFAILSKNYFFYRSKIKVLFSLSKISLFI